jgi:NitT/TauT family transport system permease protein
VLSGFLSGLKTAAPLSVVGAIVGEFVDSTVSGEGGIGLYIATHARNLYMDHVCAGIIIAAGLGLVLFGIASLLDSRHEKWSHLAK